MKKALVTGAAGFVGRHMTRYLRDNRWQVDGFDRLYTENDEVNGVKYFQEDLLDIVQEFDTRPYDLVVHAAAAAPHRRAIDEQKANFPYNVMLDAAMFNWAIRTKQKHVVYLSSSAVYPAHLQNGAHLQFGRRESGREEPYGTDHDWRLVESDTEPIEEPADVYGMTKLIGERMAQQARDAGVPVTVVRPFSGYGEDQSEDFPFRAFIERARRREDPFTIWGNANQVRDWIHIDDIVRGIMAIVEDEDGIALPVNLCTGVGTTMLELAKMCIAASGQLLISSEAHVHVDETAPMGVFYRVGNPELFSHFYTPTVTIEEGVKRALGRN